MFRLIFFIITIPAFITVISSCTSQNRRTVIVLSEHASTRESLAAKEVRRYIYQRSGQLLTIFHPTFSLLVRMSFLS